MKYNKREKHQQFDSFYFKITFIKNSIVILSLSKYMSTRKTYNVNKDQN